MLPPLTLLTTKLYRPPAATNRVERPALLVRLNEGLSHKLTLLAAPPGFGKSTLVSQWLDHLRLPILDVGLETGAEDGIQKPKTCWLTLDEGDNHVVQFLRYLIAAVQTCASAACPTTQSLLTATNLPSVDYLADLLVSELTTLTEPLILVLDDYHVIRSSEVHRVMRHLLRYRPPALHPVILTRTDPPLHLGRLRLTQQITEIRARDLRFGLAETRQFLERRLDRPLDEEIVCALQARTEGWVIGLQLACLSLRNQAPQDVVAHFGGGNRLLIGYLVEEVMAGLPKPVAEFLTRTALLDRFCAPLADALLADSPWPGTSQATIAELEARNLFVILLDDEGNWYRYHDLFRDFLLHRLTHERSPEAVAHLHKCASEWLAEAGLIEDALRHALSAGEEHFAANLVEAHFHSILNRRSPMHTLTRWLNLFDEEALQRHAGLLIAQAALAAFGMRLPVGPGHFMRIETLLAEDATLNPERKQSLEADLNLMHGMDAYAHDEPEVAILLLERAVAAVPPAHEFARAVSIFNLANMYTCLGDFARGRALLNTALAEAIAQQRPTMIVFLGVLATLQVYAAELPAALQTIGRVLAEAETHQTLPAWQETGYVDIWLGRALHLRGVIAYEYNDLDTATQYWRQLEPLRYRTHPAPFHDSLVGRALIAQTQGRAEEALAFAQAARQFAVETHSANLQAKSTALDIKLALLTGETAGVIERTEGFGVTANQGSAFGLTLPALTRIYALLVDASPTALAVALELCEACLARAGKMHNKYQTIQVTAMQAVALHHAGRSAEAQCALAQALALGKPGGFLHTFLELGAPMAALLRIYHAPREQADYVKRLLAAFDAAHIASHRHSRQAPLISVHGITPLTPRELEVLALVAKRLSLAEIAATLVISISTVKNHTHQIYTKLGVRNGRQAVAKAQELDLLPPA